MKQKMIQLYVIKTTIFGQPKYLADFSKRPDNKIMPVRYADTIAEAHTWNHKEEVLAAINAIHNIHDRQFKYETAVLPEGKKPHFNLQDKEALV